MRYREHIEAKIGKAISSTSVPNTNNLSSYIKLGTIEIISNIIKFSPSAAVLFETVSAELTENGFKVPSGIILKVLRRDNDVLPDGPWTNQYRPCKLIDSSNEYLAQTPGSLHYANEFNPVWVRGQNNSVNVYPEPSATAQYKVHYIEYPERDNYGKELDSETDIDIVGIKGFPKSFNPHIVLYGAWSAIKQYYLHLLNEEEDMELGQTYFKIAANMEKELTQMFITKDMLERSDDESEERRA